VMAAYGIDQEGITSILSTQHPTVTAVSKSKEVIIPSVLTAPITGTITALSLQEGVLTQTDKPVMAISNTSAYIAKVSISEDDISTVAVGDKAVISGDALGDSDYSGLVSKIYPTANRNGDATTVTVEIALTASDDCLKDGYSIKAEIFTGEAKQVISVPYEAVGQDKENTEYVYLYSAGRAIRKDVSTGAEMTYCTAIDGITTDAVVLLEPERLESGGRVIVTGEGNPVYD
ncbi:MAG: HlyD family efflux transporter periplasmic adaptor subunit, partial [Oscillospiraceae bacterium]